MTSDDGDRGPAEDLQVQAAVQSSANATRLACVARAATPRGQSLGNDLLDSCNASDRRSVVPLDAASEKVVIVFDLDTER